jgi:hypothetical protein
VVHGQVVDMTTSEPSLAREIFAVAQEKYVFFDLGVFLHCVYFLSKHEVVMSTKVCQLMG